MNTKQVVTCIDIVVELHDHGGWNFTEIAEYLGKQSASYFSSEYKSYQRRQARKRKHPYVKIVFDVLKTQGGEGLTSKQLTAQTGLHRKQVTNAVTTLLELNVVRETKVRVKRTSIKRKKGVPRKQTRWGHEMLVSATI